MNERHVTPSPWLGVIIIVYLITAVVYSIVVPLGESPDETEHFRYLQHIALTGSLPVMAPVREENVTLEAHQPPLLYLVGAGLTGWLGLDPADNLQETPCFSFDPDDNGRQHAYLHQPAEWPPRRGVYRAFQGMRWLSVLLGAATVWLAYGLGRRLVPAEERVGLVAAAVLAFNPQWIHITASLNNDVPTTFLGAALLLICIEAVKRPSLPLFFLAGLLTGLGLLTKFALIAFWPLPVLAALLPFWAHHPWLQKTCRSLDIGRTGGRQTAVFLLLVLALPLLIAGWWYGRNWQLYGDPLMWQVTLAAKGPVIARNTPFTLANLGEFLVTHFQSYWLWFGWLTVKAPTWLYWLILLAMLAAGAGLLRLIWRRELALDWITFTFCALAVAAIYASLLQYTQTVNWTGYQGRLAYAAAAPIALFLALGWANLRPWLASLPGGGLFILAVTAVPLILLPAFPRPEIYQPPPGVTHTCMRFAGGLQVEAVDAPDVVRPGNTLPVTVWGYGLQPAENPQPLVVQVRGRDGVVVGEASALVAWAAGDVISKTVPVPVMDAALPTRGVIAVGMKGADDWQTATSATDRMLETPLGVETVKIGPSTRPFILDPQSEPAVNAPDPIARPQGVVNFGDRMTLIGYEVTANGIILYWAALTPMSHDYTTFIHVVDPTTGALLAQSDGQPQRGGYPTGIWDVSEVVADFKPVDWNSLDETAQAVVGVYLLETGERLPLADGGDALPLFTVGERLEERP